MRPVLWLTDLKLFVFFVNDRLDTDVLKSIGVHVTRFIALRRAAFNNIDLFAAQKLNMTVVRVPSYSTEAVTEHTIARVLSLNRKVHRAYARLREGNFSLEGLLGFIFMIRPSE